MTDASERSGAMAAVYRTTKSKKDPMAFERLDRNKVVEASRKLAGAKGDGRNKVTANSLGGKQRPPKPDLGV